MADYTTTAQVKSYKAITGSADDTLIGVLISAASLWIDQHTHNHFTATTATRYFDTPSGRTLQLDDWLHGAPSSVTNGDGTAIAATEYHLEPYNPDADGLYHHRRITLKKGSTVAWLTATSGDDARAIAVTATCWGFSAAAPKNVRLACEALVLALYNGRFGQNAAGEAFVTASGFVVQPKDVPQIVYLLLAPYVRHL